MALEEKRKSSNEAATARAPAGMTQKRRWLVFGSNVAVAIFLATALMVGAVWLSDVLLKGKGRGDWTSSGRFSLSPRSRALVAKLPCDVRITNLYAHAPEEPASEEQWQRVQDLLTEYEMASPRITVETVNPLMDVGGVEKVVARLRERYGKELEKPKQLVEEFQKLDKDLREFLTAEAGRLETAADSWKNGPPDADKALRMVAQRWRQMADVGEVAAGGVQVLTEQALPNYTTAVSRAKEYLRQVNDMFRAAPGLFSQLYEASEKEPPAEVKAILTGGRATYTPMRTRIDAFDKKAADLPQMEFDTIRREINQGEVLLVEVGDRVKVISFDEVWVRNPSPRGKEGSEPDRLFVGEQAISSALLGLCEPERPAVLFVTFGAPATAMGGGPFGGGGGGPYAEIAERIRKANFIVEDWDLMREREMPHPEHMTKAILVLVPPPQPSMQRPMPPATPDMYKAAIDAVKSGTPVILMAEPGSMFGPGIAYAELFELFGVTPKLNAIAVHKTVVDGMGTEKALPQIEITSYPNHSITRPLGGLPTMLLTPCPLLIARELPKDVALAQPLVELPGGRDHWADTNVSDVMRGEAKRTEGEDIAGPVPLAVAAVRKVGDAEQKAVMFSDAQFAEDRVAFYRDPRDPLMREAFPGNAELLVNSILWVAGTEHLITVSPEALQARRIGDLGSWSLPLQIIIIGGLPAAVLIAGIIVYIVRRR